MKLFWIFIAILAVATAALLFKREPKPAPPLALTEPRAQARGSDGASPEIIAPTPAPIPDRAPEIPEEALTPPPASSTPSAPLEDLNTILGLPPQPASIPPPEAPTVEAPTPTAATEIAPAPEQPSATTPSTPAPDEPTPDPSAPEKFKTFEIAPGRQRTTDDGTLLYDERFPLKGAGIADDPFQVSWEYLVSASETFQPRMGKMRLPERIVALNDKFVRITGYVAFPIMAAQQNEMLSMRNMWDGCCIGVPPTPYDAIEVKLKTAASGRDRFTAFGAIEGKLQVDPYIKGNWLLGLYLMEDAALAQLKEGTDPAKHGGM